MSCTTIDGISAFECDALDGFFVGASPCSTIECQAAVFGAPLFVPTTTGLAFTGGANGQAAFTVTGSLADVNGALATLSYQGDPGFNGADLIQVDVDDLGNTGTPGALTDTASIPVTVTAENDTPTINAPAGFGATEDQGRR